MLSIIKYEQIKDFMPGNLIYSIETGNTVSKNTIFKELKYK